MSLWELIYEKKLIVAILKINQALSAEFVQTPEGLVPGKS